MARRPKKQPSPFNGLSLDDWQKSPLHVAWARQDEMFSQVLQVMHNCFIGLSAQDFLGFQKAVSVLLGLRQAQLPAEPLPPANYRDPAEGLEDDENI